MKKHLKVLHVLAVVVAALLIAGASALANDAKFSAAPFIASHNVAGRTNVQRFNGTFVARVISETSSPKDRECLRSIGKAYITLTTYASGEVQISSGANCIAKMHGAFRQVTSASTGSVTLSGIRVLSILLADDRFNASPRLQRNDHNLSHYDVEVYDGEDGVIHVAFVPPPVHSGTSETLGCPPTGAIAVTYLVDPNTLQLTAGNMAC